MARVVGVVAGLLWVAGMVLLVVALMSSQNANPFPEICGFDDRDCLVSSGGPNLGAVLGTVLVGVAGLLTAGLVLVERRR